MIEHHDIILPESLSPFLSCSYGYDSTIVSSASGRDFVRNNCDFPKRFFKISNARVNSKQMDEIVAFFTSRKGALYSFRLKDHSDFSVSEQFIGISNGEAQRFKLFKSYNDMIMPSIRYISLPIIETIKLRSEYGKIRYEYDAWKGEIILLDILEPGQNIYISFEFDIKARFITDKIEYSLCADGSIALKEINIKEVIDA